MEEAVAGDARIVHHHVDGAEILLDLRQTCCAGVIAGDVPLVDGDAGFFAELGGRLVIARVICGDGIACGFKRFGDGGANAA